MSPALLWSVLGLVLIFCELIIPGLVLVFFGAGALVTALICLIFDPSQADQILIFLGCSIGSIVFTRHFFKSIFMGNETRDNSDSEFIGHTATVTTEIHPEKPGRVELNGTSWNAEADQPISIDTRVEITNQKSLVLFVKPKN